MDTAASNGDKVKIDIALVYQEIRHLTTTINEFIGQQRICNNGVDARLRDLENGQVERRTQIETLKGEIEKLRKKSDEDKSTSRIMAVVVSSILATVAAVIGALVK